MPNPSPRILIVAGIALAAVVGAGGYSLGAASTPPVDTACVTVHHVPVHIYARNVACPRGQHKIQWNQRGPAGPQGPSGFDGGIAPSAEAVLGNGLDSVTDTCPANASHATGGGYQFGPKESGVPWTVYPVIENGPVNTNDGATPGWNAWTVTVQLPPGGGATTTQLEVTVICAQ